MHSATRKRNSSATYVQNSRGRRSDNAGGNGRPRFAHAWHEIEHLYLRVLEAYYDQEDKRRALRYLPRLEKLLRQEDSNHQAILGEECWALLRELRGDLSAAITHRLNQVRLIRRLWQISENDPEEVRRFALRYYGPADLADRYDLLAILYRDAGQLKKAIKTLWQSRELCELHGVNFDGKDLLRDYLAEYRAKRPKAKPSPTARRNG
jgi:tetratricopeptide (TPR) repeat protein